jgi:FKBP-type peptidyl-prolyl cis-trans isomerase
MKKTIFYSMAIALISLIACEPIANSIMRNDWILMNYKLTKRDGTRLDETMCYKECSQLKYSPFKSKIGAGWLVPAWDNGLLGMTAGESKRILIAPNQGWGQNPPPGVLPQDTLILEVRVVEILKSY